MTTKTKTLTPNRTFIIEVRGEELKVNKFGDKLHSLIDDLGWEYTSGRMSRSGMYYYDKIAVALGLMDKGEHWNEDVYADANGDW